MTTATHPSYRSLSKPLHATLHATLLGATVPLFLSATLSDIAYYRSYQVQWSNLSSWLIAAGLVFCGLAILFALADLARANHDKGRTLLYLLLLLATGAVGFINALEHAKDAWATMPLGLLLSAIVTLLAGAATWIGFSGSRAGGAA
nr:DUF2231 domain-containing protein [uncultured Pseudomonas sp.]